MSEEVVVEARRDGPNVSEETLDRERVLKTPGTFEDPVRLVQSLPGVAVTPEYSPTAGDLAVRGSGPGENRFRLDGIDLPYLYHFNGYSSVFHNRLLETLTLYPSTFGAPLGNATGAVVDTRSTWAPPEQWRGSVNVNPIMAGLETSAPIGERWVVRASGRRSFLDLGTNNSDQYTVFPRFWDYFGRVELDGAWGLLAFGAGDSYSRYAGEPALLDPYERSLNPSFAYSQAFHVAAFVHRNPLANGRLDGNLAYTWYSREGELPAAVESRLDHRIQLREDATFLLAPWFVAAVGGEATGAAVTLRSDTSRAWPEVEDEAALLGRGAALDEELTRFTGGVYAESRLTVGPVRVVPGARFDGDSLSGVTVDPRLGARWEIAPDLRVRAGAGRYSQFASTEVLATHEFGPARSWQAAAGIDGVLFGRIEVSVDGYAKDTENLVVVEPGEDPRGGVRGFAYGGEIESRYRLRDVFFASIALAAGRSERDEETFDYDQPWAANAVASWTFAPSWNAGLRFRAAAGMPYTPIVDGSYLGASDTYAPVLGETNSERLPTYTKLDLHLEKTFRLGRAALTTYAELWWVPSGSNVMYLAWRYDYDESAAVGGPEVVPLLGVRGEI